MYMGDVYTVVHCKVHTEAIDMYTVRAYSLFTSDLHGGLSPLYQFKHFFSSI